MVAQPLARAETRDHDVGICQLELALTAGPPDATPPLRCSCCRGRRWLPCTRRSHTTWAWCTWCDGTGLDPVAPTAARLGRAA